MITKSRHGPQAGELAVEMASMASATEGCRHAQIPNSKAAGSPFRKQIEPASVGGKSKIAWTSAAHRNASDRVRIFMEG